MDYTSATFWAILGLVLLGVEAITLSFTLVFFGIAAFAVALIKFISGWGNLYYELIFFALFGIASLLIFRHRLTSVLNSKNKDRVGDHLAAFVLSADLPPNGRAEVEYQGVVWTAINSSSTVLKKGQVVRIQRTEGIKLIVEAAPESAIPRV